MKHDYLSSSLTSVTSTLYPNLNHFKILSYERKREAAGEAFYPDSGTLIHGTHKDSKDAIDRMAQDVEKQVSYWSSSTRSTLVLCSRKPATKPQ